MYKVLKKIGSLQFEISALQQADTALRKQAGASTGTRLFILSPSRKGRHYFL